MNSTWLKVSHLLSIKVIWRPNQCLVFFVAFLKLFQSSFCHAWKCIDLLGEPMPSGRAVLLYLVHNSVLNGGVCQVVFTWMDPRIPGGSFPAEHLIIMRLSMLLTSPVIGLNVMANRFIYCILWVTHLHARLINGANILISVFLLFCIQSQ